MGSLFKNTKRYEKVFDDAFHHFPNFKKDDDTIRINYGAIASGNNVQYQDNQDLRYINVLSLETLSDEKHLKQFMVNILKKVALRKLDRKDDFCDGIKFFYNPRRSYQLCIVMHLVPTQSPINLMMIL